MSHKICYEVYADKATKTKKARSLIQAQWDTVAAHEDWQEGCDGLPDVIHWKDDMEPFKDKDAAYKYVEEMSYRSDYLQIAVPFYRYECNDKLKELMAKLEEAKAELEQAKKPHYSVDTVKSQFITCRHCGSKLAVKYIKSNKCPLCGEDLRPQSAQDKVKRLMAKVKKMEGDVQKKKQRYAKVYWLVKIEFHV